jgi:hypothetical protein
MQEKPLLSQRFFFKVILLLSIGFGVNRPGDFEPEPHFMNLPPQGGRAKGHAKPLVNRAAQSFQRPMNSRSIRSLAPLNPARHLCPSLPVELGFAVAFRLADKASRAVFAESENPVAHTLSLDADNLGHGLDGIGGATFDGLKFDGKPTVIQFIQGFLRKIG